MKYVVGIDEAGRGPLAGPVSVAAVAIPEYLYKKTLLSFRGVKDSKKLSPEKRAKWLKHIRRQKEGAILYSVSLVGSTYIDKRGIVQAVFLGMKRTLEKIEEVTPGKARVLLDGSLFAPPQFKNQRTIIRGDEKKKIIALASIVAKEHRDAHMRRQAKKYPEYGFEVHKGYGTKAHLLSIRKHGVSEIHRKSFLKNLKF